MGGARTALFNALYARGRPSPPGARYIVRVEDTDVARSTCASELAVLRDLEWLGLLGDEGDWHSQLRKGEGDVGAAGRVEKGEADVGATGRVEKGEGDSSKGAAKESAIPVSASPAASSSSSDASPSLPFGPYRSSERMALYRSVAERLLSLGAAYECFETDGERAAAREAAAARGLPPPVESPWARASEAERAAARASGLVPSIRMRIDRSASSGLDEDVTFCDHVRGVVRARRADLADFVLIRSTGVPVYNFAVAVDDAAQGVTHVLRAEEHLTNTFRQLLVLAAIGAVQTGRAPEYAHLSLILSPDRTKLSKRHGATSVAEFRDEGFLPTAMLNGLALLGWNDGTERELYASLDELTEAFSLDRVGRAPAVFDLHKLRWINQQHIKQVADEDLQTMLEERWAKGGLLARKEENGQEQEANGSTATSGRNAPTSNPSTSAAALTAPAHELARAATMALRESIATLREAETGLQELLGYPLEALLAHPEHEGAGDLADPETLRIFLPALRAALDDGSLANAALEDGGIKAWTKALGKQLQRKGKGLFMPLRIALSGRTHGPDLGTVVKILVLAERGGVPKGCDAHVTLDQRLRILENAIGGKDNAQ